MRHFLETTAFFCGLFWLCSGDLVHSGPSGVFCNQILEEVIPTGIFGHTHEHKSSIMTRMLFFFPALFILLLAIPSALATTEDAGAISEQVGDVEALSQELDADYRQALTELVAVDSEVSRHSNDISEITQKQAETQAAIVAEQTHLQEFEARLVERQGVLEKRLRGTYKSADIGYLEVVMGAGDFSDFLNRVDMMNYIADDDRALIVSVQEAKQGIEDKIASLAEMQNQLTVSIDELNAAQSSLLDAQSRQQSYVNSLESEKLAADGQLAQLQAQAASIESQMNQIQQQADSSGGGYDQNTTPPASGGSSFSVTSTAYCLGGTTATGMPVGYGIIAVDPRVIPLGSRVHVSGYGDAIAADTGGAIRGNKIDVWLSCGEAMAWGVRTVTVTVY